MPGFTQRSFTGGELAPSLYARVDTVKYATGLKTCRNFIVQKHGGVVNRPGFRYIGELPGEARLIPFVFSGEQAYVLAFGNKWMRVIRDGMVVAGNNGQPYQISHPYTLAQVWEMRHAQSGDQVTLTHPSGRPRVLSRYGHADWRLSTEATEPAIDRPLHSWAASNKPNYSAPSLRYRITAVQQDTGFESVAGLERATQVSSATATNPVQLTVPGHWFKNGDEVYLNGIAGQTELNTRTFRVSLVGQSVLTLIDEDGTGRQPGSGGWVRRTYARIDERLPSDEEPIKVTWQPVAGASEYNIYKSTGGAYGYIGTATGLEFVDVGIVPDVSDTPPIYRDPWASGDYPAVVTFAQQRKIYGAMTNEPEKLWLSRIGDYRNFSSRSPLQADDAINFTLAGRQLNEIRHVLDLGRLVILTGSGEWIAEGSQGGVLTPTSINLRQQGYNGSSHLSPIISDNNALYVQARGSIVRDLRYQLESDGYTGTDLTVFASHLVDGRQIVDWTYQQTPSSVVWAVRDDGNVIAMTYMREHDIWGWHRHDTRNGAFESITTIPERQEDAVYAVIRREIEGQSRYYVERLEKRFIQSVAEDAFFVDSGLTYDGRNQGSVTLQLVKGGVDPVTPDIFGNNVAWFRDGESFPAGEYEIRYEQGTMSYNPASLQWSVNYSNPAHGYYVRDGDGDHWFPAPPGQWSTREACRAANAGSKLVVQHTGGPIGVWLNDQPYSDNASGDPSPTFSLHSTLIPSTDRTYLESSAGLFSPSQEGNLVALEFGSVKVRARIVAVLSPTRAEVALLDQAGPELFGVPTRDWAQSARVLRGIDHLEGQEVAILADGEVHPRRIVRDGTVTLERAVTIAHVGLPIESDLETLVLDSPGESLTDRRKLLTQVTVFVESSRGMWAGPSFDRLTEYKQRTDEKMNDPVRMTTGVFEVLINAAWDSNGRVVIRQRDPLPLSVLSITPSGIVSN